MKTIRNFRSLGGIKTHLGTTKHKLFRGGPLNLISQEDQATLYNDLDVRLVLDLRSLEERTHSPNKAIQGIQHCPLQLMNDGSDSDEPHEIMNHLKNCDFQAFMVPMYQSFVSSEYTRRKHQKMIELLVENPNSTYFHCSAGKDRTGYSAALILRLLGADFDTIMQEYLLTNKQDQRFRDEILKETQARNGVVPLDNNDQNAILYVSPDYLQATFKEIDDRFGSFENYVKEGLRLDETTIHALQSIYLD